MNSLDPLSLFAYLSIIVLVWIPYGLHGKRRSSRSRALLADARRTGMGEPP